MQIFPPRHETFTLKLNFSRETFFVLLSSTLQLALTTSLTWLKLSRFYVLSLRDCSVQLAA